MSDLIEPNYRTILAKSVGQLFEVSGFEIHKSGFFLDKSSADDSPIPLNSMLESGKGRGESGASVGK